MLGIAVEVCPAAAAPRATSRAGTRAAATPAVDHPDLLDPRGPMSMPKIVSRAANSLGRGQHDGGNVAAGIFVLSVLAIIIALGILFIVGGPR